MIVCKPGVRLPLDKGKTYRKAVLFPVLDGGENRSPVIFDPLRDELFSFVKEDSEKFDNRYKDSIFSFRSRDGSTLRESTAWERTKIRHLFFQRKGQNDGDFEYLGASVDEKNLRDASGSVVEVQYEVL